MQTVMNDGTVVDRQSGIVKEGVDCRWGQNVTVNVSEELIVGNRCVIPDNAHFEGRRITIGDDFYGYSWEWKRLDVGRGRIDDERAILTIGDRCTFHDNRIDLACRVTIGDDVGLSPEVTIYTHGYWQSPLEGYPVAYAPVTICDGVIVGFRSTILAGSSIGRLAVIGAQSLIVRSIPDAEVWGGVPACRLRYVTQPIEQEQRAMFERLSQDYASSCSWRKLMTRFKADFPVMSVNDWWVDCLKLQAVGVEDEQTDDLRDFLFKHGIRIYTKRPFKKLRSKR
jgi:acetyltransferase-like isoleucine patch superfamily enzyme